MPDKKYTQEDFEAFAVRVGALKDFAETLTYVDGRANNPPAPHLCRINRNGSH
jgi:hypothetical protein